MNGALIAGRAVVVSDGLAGCICGRAFGVVTQRAPPCERDNFGESAAVQSELGAPEWFTR